MAYTAVDTAIRLIPMFVSGIVCNLIVGFMAAHIPLVWILGALFLHAFILEKSLTILRFACSCRCCRDNNCLLPFCGNCPVNDILGLRFRGHCYFSHGPRPCLHCWRTLHR